MRHLILVLLASSWIVADPGLTQGSAATRLQGLVRDSAGASVPGADVVLMSANQVILGSAKTDVEGRFTIANVPRGTYLLIVTFRGFAQRRVGVSVLSEDLNIEVVLEPAPVSEEVTVTANQGIVESIETVTQQVNVISELEIDERAKAVVAQAAAEEVGIHLQRTSPTISGIYVRGLTGNKVNVFIDGVRYSNSAQRGGINTFLNLIEPSNLQAIEVLRGPNSAQYGSDAIGGSIQFLSRVPSFASDGLDVTGKLGWFFNTADGGFGSTLSTSVATRNLGLLMNLAGRRVNTLRPGKGLDSHNAMTRFFDLPSSVAIGDRLPDTAFTQYGGMAKMNWSPRSGHQLIAGYIRSQQDGGRRYDQLLGGDGNLLADLRNFMLDFFYVKYDKHRVGWFDGLTLSYSFNSQREERVNQGGNGNPTASVNHEFERTTVNGLQGNLTRQAWARQNLLIGAEVYHEGIDSPSFSFSPTTGLSTLRRGRVPDESRFTSGGIYVQDILEVVRNRVRVVGNARYSAASYRARAADSPIVNGQRLWGDDSLRVDDVAGRVGVVVTPRGGLSFSANFSRGFRAPHMTDLGTLGLTGSGFEVAAPDVAGLGATIGSTADTSALSSGRPVVQLVPETSQSYEVAARYFTRRFDTDFAFFVNDVNRGIVKQSLILPPGSVGLRLGDQVITEQNANGVVFVAASPTPVLVRANFEDVRLYGFEHTANINITRAWSAGTTFTYVRARDKQTDLPPNIEGGIPAPDGYLRLRWAPPNGRYWIEPYIHAAYRQDRLSSLALEDRRTGATRSRPSIRNFFLNGARARGFISPGPDGLFGTVDDFLLPTGETLLQIQNRVLPVGVESAPLFSYLPGYVVVSVRGGVRWKDRHQLIAEFDNIADRNYRGVSWGVDAPGRGFYMKYVTYF